MPLTGEAKKLYQREYMRHYMRGRRGWVDDWSPDDYCKACNRHGIVDKHHIDCNYNNNGDDNVVALCPNCHAEIHRRSKTLEDITILDANVKTPQIDADGYVIPDY